MFPITPIQLHPAFDVLKKMFSESAYWLIPVIIMLLVLATGIVWRIIRKKKT